MGEEETLRKFCWWEEGLGLWKAEGVTQKLAVSPGWRAKSQPQLPVKWGDSPLQHPGRMGLTTFFFLHRPRLLCPGAKLGSAPARSEAATTPTLSPSLVDCDQDPLDPVYLPVALGLLDAPEHFRVQQVGRYPPANSSLGSRSETFLLLQPWPRAQPLLRASYPPFATQQVRRRHQSLLGYRD